ncbi:MAG: hypothetical protein K2P81_17060 [Bacteriovoracaceae bacterium]|nr:hypothetical protein [Bacteriovoracaceae bacterium]
MQLTLGFVRSSSQILLKDLDWEQNQISTRLIDATDLPDQNLQGLFVGQNEHFEQLLSLLDKEKTHYPIFESSNFDLTYSVFEDVPAFQFKELCEKAISRWQISNNFKSLEEIFAFTTHMRVLWHKDRMSFHEELWYWLKRNLSAVDLTLVFNDVVQSEQKNEEGQKEQKPKLTQSLLSGTKKANFMTGAGKEQQLMEKYLDKWNEQFEITEWDATKARFVATVMIEKSPLIIMGRVTSLSQLQRSLLFAFFKGLQGH